MLVGALSKRKLLVYTVYTTNKAQNSPTLTQKHNEGPYMQNKALKTL